MTWHISENTCNIRRLRVHKRSVMWTCTSSANQSEKLELDPIFVVESLGEPHLNMENGTVALMQVTMSKTELQHTTVVWNGGSCSNKSDKLMDTSIQVLCNAKLFNFVYICKYVYLCVCTYAWVFVKTIHACAYIHYSNQDVCYVHSYPACRDKYHWSNIIK